MSIAPLHNASAPRDPGPAVIKSVQSTNDELRTRNPFHRPLGSRTRMILCCFGHQTPLHMARICGDPSSGEGQGGMADQGRTVWAAERPAVSRTMVLLAVQRVCLLLLTA